MLGFIKVVEFRHLVSKAWILCNISISTVNLKMHIIDPIILEKEKTYLLRQCTKLTLR